ncbi:hypothetical protein BHE74_00053381 [Ensete ventricosum]|nr:hypothetical protein GW17_00060764 [Ensete ventricosum]RWW41142.1 hypothetical protein BHE74_00053381 [Ensete ventricosum]
MLLSQLSLLIMLALLPCFPRPMPLSRPLLLPISLYSSRCPSFRRLLPYRHYLLLQRTSLDNLAASPQPPSLITLQSLLLAISRS